MTGATVAATAIEPVRPTSDVTVRPVPGEDDRDGSNGTESVEPAPQEAPLTTSWAGRPAIPPGDSGEAAADLALPASLIETARAETILDAPAAVSSEEVDQRDLTAGAGHPGEEKAELVSETEGVGAERPSGAPVGGEPEESVEEVAEEKGRAERTKPAAKTKEKEEKQEKADASGIADERDADALARELEATAIEEEEETEEESGPARYRAPVLGPGKPQRKQSARSSPANQDSVLEMRIRAICDRHGFYRFRVVGRRPDGAPEELEARDGRRSSVLSEVADNWYEVGELNDLPEVMERGCRLSAPYGNGDEITWELRGRDLYVLAELHGLSGFVSTPRLSIGRKQLVTCRETRAAEVQAILAETGCDSLQAYGEGHGAPVGWVFFGPVVPCRSIPQLPGDDILNVIRPIPDVEVRLEGGLWLRDSCWIAGYAPKIRVVGEIPLGTEVTIDGEKAVECEEGVYVAGNSERVGNHIVWCAGKSARYEICESDVRWEDWQVDGFMRRVFGAAVAQSGNACETLVNVPTSNPVLIGANPGEFFRCDARSGKQWSGLVPFPVCWALPEDALHCDRSVRRVLLVTPILPVHAIAGTYWNKRRRASVLLWCQAIRDCQQKRLTLMPTNAASEDLWREYKREARAVWRAVRRA